MRSWSEVFRPQHRLDVQVRLDRRHAVEDRQLLFLVRIGQLQLEHEAVDLRFGQRIGSFLFDGVLRGQHQERLFEQVASLADGDLPFLHRFEQGALHLGGSPVDLVGEDEVGEDGPLLDGEFAGARVVDLRADHVGRQQIGRELDAAEGEPQGAGEGADGERLGQAGHAFEEHVPAGEQADEQPVERAAAGRR